MVVDRRVLGVGWHREEECEQGCGGETKQCHGCEDGSI
jgi:hypothetical protein